MAQVSGLLKFTKPGVTSVASVARWLALIACVILAAMVVVVVVDVGGRLLFNQPLKGGYEIVALAYILIVMISLAHCESQNAHLRLSFVVDLFPTSIQELALAASRVIFMYTYLVMGWQFLVLPVGTSTDLLIPLQPFSILAGFGAGLLVLAVLANLAQQLADSKNKWHVLAGIAVAVGIVVGGFLLVGVKGLTPPEAGVVFLIAMTVFMLLGIHIGPVLVLSGIAGMAYIRGVDIAVLQIAAVPWYGMNSFVFAVIPLFILMGVIAGESGIATMAYEAARAWVGQVKGGLGIATVIACAAFAAVASTTLATVMTIGKIAYPEMDKFGYDRRLSTGAVAAGSTLGPMIPPSASFIIIGLLADMSIGQLFMAGVIPGLVHALVYAATIYIICRFRPKMGPAAPATTFKQKVLSVRLIWAIGLLFVFCIGGIYAGWFTPTEAGGIGAFGALVIALVLRRFSRHAFGSSLMETIVSVGTVSILIIGGLTFAKFIVLSQVPVEVGKWVVALNVPGVYIILILLAIFWIWGIALSSQMLLIMTIPVVFPLVTSLGYDPLWWSVIMVTVIEMGEISPPYGISLFAMQITTKLPMNTIFWGVIPFCIADFVFLALLIAFPGLATWLPGLMVGR